eukprot:11626_1
MKLNTSMFHIFLLFVCSTLAMDAGNQPMVPGLNEAKQIIDILKSVKHESHSDLLPNHPVSTLGRMSFKNLNLSHEQIVGTMKIKKVKNHFIKILKQYAIPDRDFIAELLEDYDTIDKWTKSHFYYKMPNGGVYSFHFVAIPLDQTRAKVGVWIESATFTLQAERLVVDRSKSGLTYSKTWKEIIYLDPRLEPKDVEIFIKHTLVQFSNLVSFEPYQDKLQIDAAKDHTKNIIEPNQATNIKSDKVNDDIIALTEFLRKWRVEKYLNLLVSQGVESLDDFKGLDEEEIAEIADEAEMKRLHKKKFIKAVHQLQSEQKEEAEKMEL